MRKFKYQGMTFEPVQKLTDAERGQLYKHAGPKVEIPNYSHAEFYRAARTADAGKFDLFRTDDRVFIPCGGQAIEWKERS
jgi:hypothetical protein